MSEHAVLDRTGASPGERMASVQLDHVSKDFGTTRVVDDVSLTVQQGEFLTLLGPSGCGKTTTLRLIGGFEQPTAGRIFIDGQEMGDRPPYRRPVNTVFQSYALFPHMTVEQNVSYGLAMSGVGKQERQRRVADVLELVRLPDVESRRPSQLSGGQQQRVALARALINQPQVLLLDEPLGALDLKLRKAMQLELKNLNREIGITFIYVTHDQDEALTMSDRIAVMSNGRILQVGDPQSIYEYPQSRFVAEFIGETNILRGTVETCEGDLALIGIPGVGQVRALRATSDSLPAGTPVDLVVRPERMTIHRATDLREPDRQENRLDGVIVEAIYRGTHTQFVVRLADGQSVVVHVQNSYGSSEVFYVGDRIELLLLPQSATVLAS